MLRKIATTESKSRKKRKRKVRAGENVHPLSAAIDFFLRRVLDIQELATVFIPISAKVVQSRVNTLGRELEKYGPKMASKKTAERVKVIRHLERIIHELQELDKSDMPNVLEASLFNALFSALDAFMGDLLTALYTKRPELFSSMNRTVPVKDILRFGTFDEIKKKALDEEIDSFRRNSYEDQFQSLENTFDIKLKDFSRWPDFIECTQRRNLLTHCDGVVSEQYIKTCTSSGVKLRPEIKIGHKIQLGRDYFMASSDLLGEVAFKLTHTLWRKVLPSELADADKYLSRTIYDLLFDSRWKRAQVFGEFAMNQKRFSSDLDKRICLVNYAIALKFGGNPSEAKKVMASTDWSAASYDFKIANAVLTDDLSGAAGMMREMGSEGELISEEAYHVWPLFKEFRESESFLKAYQAIYKRPFILELKKAADVAKRNLVPTKSAGTNGTHKRKQLAPNSGNNGVHK